MKVNNLWLTYAIITTIFWGVWGALIEIPEKNGFSGNFRVYGLGLYYGSLCFGWSLYHKVET